MNTVKAEVTAGKYSPREAFSELERSVHAALETYSNVQRGSGHNSMVSTYLYEQARAVVLDFMGLNKRKYVVIFCTSIRKTALSEQLKPSSYRSLSSADIGLALGVHALAVKRRSLSKGVPLESGGGTTRLVSKEWIIWADAPDRFEAGTPAIINVIAFARALQLIHQFGKDIFLNPADENTTAKDILYKDELEKFQGKEMLDELRKTLIAHRGQVPTMNGSKPFINFDNSASTRTFTPVWTAFLQTLQQTPKVKLEIINEVKSICAKTLGASEDTYDVIFTSNTTEAINLAAKSLSRENEQGIEPVILNSLLEHSSNDLPWRMVPGCSLIRLSINKEGFLDLNEMESLLKTNNQEEQFGNHRIRMVAISGASNVLGICNNIGEISKIVHRYGARLLVDAAQLVAHRKVDMDDCGIDFLAFSGHKVYAPFGCGVLVCRKGLLNFSSTELEEICLSGQENAGGIAALGKALLLLQRIGMDVIREDEQALTRQALVGLAKIPGLRIYGVTNPDSPGFANKIGVIVFRLENMMADQVAKRLAGQHGIGVRYGCHCAHILIKHLLGVSPKLERFQRFMLTLIPKMRLPGLTRISMGLENTEQDVSVLINAISNLNKSNGSNVKKQMNDFVANAALSVYSKP